jgi:RimJ/RimL family protein N-acetyltransferase
MKIETLHAYTHAENGASNHILEKNGMQFIEEYSSEDGTNWKWWQLESKKHKSKLQNP